MSVYTAVRRAELETWLTHFSVGSLLDMRGISAGIENSNYFVDTTGGRFVLTLFESLAAAPLAFYLALQMRLAEAGFPCPRPQATRDGHLQQPLAGKPAALLSRLPGAPIDLAAPAHCREIGRQLARFHLLTARFAHLPPHSRDIAWRRDAAARLAPRLPREQQELLAWALAVDTALPWPELPQGLIHADLFRDNVLWDGEQLGGLLDFYFAGRDALLFDLAVTANDWCLDEQGRPDPAREAAFLEGYGAERSLTPGERTAWPAMLASAALRFWLSRLEVTLAPRRGELVTLKDPEDFRRLLERRLAACPAAAI